MYVSDFLIRLLDIVIWPITLLIIVYWFKKEFQGIFGRLKKLDASASGISIETFDQKLQKAKKLIKAMSASKSLDEIEDLTRDKSMSPANQVKQLEKYLNESLITFAESKNIRNVKTGKEAATELKNAGILNLKKYKLIHSAFDLIDEAPNDITEEQINIIEKLVKAFMS